MMIYYKDEETGEIYHYGIKGQHWGVRRYQNEDGTYTEEGKARRIQSYGGKGDYAHLDKHNKNFDEDFIIKKGTKYGRVTDAHEENLSKNKRTFVGGQSFGEYADYLDLDWGKNIHYDTLETKRDTLIAGRNTMKSILDKIGGSNAKKISEAVTLGQDEYVNKKMGNSFYIDPIKEKELRKKYFNEWSEYADFMNNKKYKKVADTYIKELNKQGYDATIDPRDGGNNNTEYPFDPDAMAFVSDVLKRTESEWYDPEGNRYIKKY